jgi:hypothetical protein
MKRVRHSMLALLVAAMVSVAMAAPASAGLEGRGGGALVLHDPCTVSFPDGTTLAGFDNTVITPKDKSLTTGCNTHTKGKHKGWLK